MKKFASLLLIAMVLCISIAILINISSDESLPSEGSFIENFETAISKNIPFREKLNSLVSSIKYASGVRHFGDIYIGSEGSLLRDIENPNSRTFSAAKNYILSYSETNQIKPYFMLVPTASVILQQEIENFASEDIYNQRNMISNMYARFDGNVRTTDVFQTLFDRRGEYIYYHTEDMPTSLGGYYIYSELCSRLGLRPNTMDSFSASYVAHGFYGSLADDFFRPFASPDFITLYEYVGANSDFVIEYYTQSGRSKFREGLYFYDDRSFEDKTDMIFGGISPMMNIIQNNNPDGKGSILIFGDETAKSWLPFLISNYKKITFVDLDSSSSELLSAIKTSDYDQVLFAYSSAVFARGVDFSKLEFVR